jgi:hypothetical protein
VVKIIGRTLMILLTSSAVAGGIYFIVRSRVGEATAESGWRNFEDAGSGGGRAGSGAFRERPTDPYSERRLRGDGMGGHRHDSESRFSLGHGLAGILRSMAVISLITFIVARLRRSSICRS